MTDAERWDTCRSVGSALQLISRATKSVNPGWNRKLRLCACRFLREQASAFPDGRFAHALDIAERHFEGELPLADLKAAVAEAQRGYEVHRCDLEGPDEGAAQRLATLIDDPPRQSVGAALNRPGGAASEAANAIGVALLREMFGNPFRPVAFGAWRTDTAVAIAREMYASQDFGAMPILADALQDAGCDDAAVLSHCRDANQVHVRGCWVVDGVLGKA